MIDAAVAEAKLRRGVEEVENQLRDRKYGKSIPASLQGRLVAVQRLVRITC